MSKILYRCNDEFYNQASVMSQYLLFIQPMPVMTGDCVNIYRLTHMFHGAFYTISEAEKYCEELNLSYDVSVAIYVLVNHGLELVRHGSYYAMGIDGKREWYWSSDYV